MLASRPSARRSVTMIELSSESLVPVRSVPKLLPTRPNGRRVHISAVYRWIKRGVRGVRLESTQVGGTTYTSHEALQRFSEQLSKNDRPAVSKMSRTRARQRQIDRAARQVEAILGVTPN
ncbi:MAG: DUF1580 domain-containing protein [Phycisphaera sp.]|nr:DUF1580 domain-containing protein [Phycisphaera sp.]